MKKTIKQRTKYPDRGEHICVYCGEYAEYKLKSGRWCCCENNQNCPAIKHKNSEGLKRAHKNGAYDNLSVVGWSKGLTAETDDRLKKISKTLKEGYASGRLTPTWAGKKLSKETLEKISESMKRAHAEGRAHNIGQSRWNNEPSYPEKWFIEVIKNEFDDKNYKREYPFKIYSLDFAWVDKKKCIEIDGDQHQRFEEYKARDLRKDEALKSNDWQILRLVWKDVFANPKEYIKIANEFIGKP
jgi:very-short-patch-repair endonuclease